MKRPGLRGIAAALCCAALLGVTALTACSASAQTSGAGASDAQTLDEGSEDGTRLTAGEMAADTPSYATSYTVAGPTHLSGGNTGTAVGQKVGQLRGDLTSLESSVTAEAGQLDSLRASTRANAADYFMATAAIEAKLQVGTTRGNPILVAQMQEAQGKLDTLSQDLSSYNALSTEAAQSGSQAAFLLQSVRATYGLSGAVDEDHVALGALEDDTNREVVKIDRLLNGISGDLSRQSTYVATERRNLQTLALAVDNGEMYGQSLANRPYTMTSLSGAGRGNVTVKSPAASAPAASARPLVVIRFTQDNVDYQGAVYQAVSQAIDRYPQANFTIMAVSPAGSNAADGALAVSDAQRNADSVARTLSQMGIASSHIQLSQATAAGIGNSEVRIYVR